MSGITGHVVFLGVSFAKKGRNNSKKEKKNIICLICVEHMMHMKHMKFEKGFFERTAGANAFQRMGYELLPPSAAVPLPRGGRSGVSPVKAFGLAVDCI